MIDKIVKVFENNYVLALMYVVLCFLIVKLVDKIFKRIISHKEDSIKLQFLSGIIKIAIIIFFLFRIAALSTLLSSFSNTILMSSSLIVVVLGFIFQEGLSNIIHGFIITVFRPFKVGDRVEINNGTERLTGYVREVTLRHTVITGVIDNAEYIIPNSVLDNCVIRNLTTVGNNKYPLKVSITYNDAADENKLRLAKSIFSAAVLDNDLTRNSVVNDDGELNVKIDMSESSVDLTVFVETRTAEENFLAATQIKEKILKEFPEAGITFAYNHLEISGRLDT